MFKLLETRIVNYRVMMNGDKRITLEVQDEDFDNITQDQLLEYWRDKVSFVAVFQEYGEEYEESKKTERPQLLQELGAKMSIYCRSQGIDIEKEVERVQKQYGVDSRKELTDTQLRELIDSYTAGLQFN